VKGFTVEHADVLLSVQMVLTREEEGRRRQLAQAATRPAQQAPHPASRPSQPVRPSVRTSGLPPQVVRHPSVQQRAAAASARPLRVAAPAPQAAQPSPRPSGPVPIGKQVQPAGSPVMVDPLTGIGTIHALRRDLMLEQTWPMAGRGALVLVAVEIVALDKIRADMGPEAANHVLKSLVEVAPFTLRAQDRVYRSGRNQLTLILPGVDKAAPEGARAALETALQRRVAGHGYPEPHLAARRLDPVALAS
jgi:GGDEF domain-containing protein